MIRSKRGPSDGAADGCTDGAASGCPSCGEQSAPAARFCSQCGARLAPSLEAGSDKPARPSLSERRQVTVLFCDLVGSTELAARLDPEEMVALMERYQDLCARAIAPFEGRIAQTLGDGLLVYFGYPEAHEDDGRRAVHAGLAITAAIHDPEHGLRAAGVACAVRVGIDTGLVVAGELSRWDTRADMALVGETPNIAARLQALAKPNQVLIGPKTERLVRGHIEVAALGPQTLKGLERPLPVYEARAVRPSHSAAPEHARTTPLLGRSRELAELLEHWRAAAHGGGRIVVIAGAAGIGKSRLIEALRASIDPERPLQLRYHCSPYFQNSALHPIIEQIAHASGMEQEDPATVRMQKLEQLLRRSSLQLEHDTAQVAQLMQIPTRAPERSPLSPQRQLDDLVEVLIAQLVQLAAHGPVLMTLEDAHWIDPTTLSFLQQLGTRLTGTRLLVTITHRTRFTQPWSRTADVRQISLERLPPAECRNLVEHLSLDKRLPKRVLDEIVARSDGLPLFVEELTKAVLESDGERAPLTVPSSLQDSLTARLDRLGAYKLIAQLGACIGRSFSYALLAEVSELEPSVLRAGLLRLVAAEILLKRGEFPEARFEFRHALVQNAAYESLLRSERRRIHAALARRLEARPKETEQHPEVLAQHWTAAGEHAAAIPLWLRAGHAAQSRSAHAEALAHLEAGLRSLHQVPRTPERDGREIRLQLAIARSRTTGEGWSGSRVREAYARALELSRSIADPAQECEGLSGLWGYHIVRAEFAGASGRAREHLQLAERTGDRRAILLANSAALITHFCVADFARANEHAGRIRAEYRPDEDSHLSHFLIHDPEVIASIYEGLWLWLQGDFDRAAERSRRGIERARQLRDPFQLCYALINGSAAFVFRGEYDCVRAQVDEALHLAAESRIPVFQVYGPLVATPALVERDPTAATLKWLRRCVETMHDSHALMHVPFYDLQLAAAYGTAGDLPSAYALVMRALSLVERAGERWIEPELYRVRAGLVLAESRNNRAQAEHWLRHGLALAEAMGASGLALRLACDLAELLGGGPLESEASARLQAAAGSVMGGSECPDLERARQLLEGLSKAV